MPESRAAPSPAVSKRRNTSQHFTVESRKRRASYVLRACDVCKRRKGRCDGHQPCQHCQKRSIECHYATHPQLGPDEVGNVSNLRAEDGQCVGTVSLNLDKVNSIKSQIENLQRQLDELVTELEPQSMDGQSALPSPSRHQRHVLGAKSSSAPLRESTYLPNFHVNKSKHSISRFYGSSSSEYSLNLAQTKLCQTQDLDDSPIARPDYETIPGLDDETNIDHELSINPEDPDIFRQPRETPYYNTITQVPRLLSKSEALRLLHVYQEVVGELHPIVDIQYLFEQVETLYTIRDNELSSRRINALQIDDDGIHILNIVCSIALTAETTGQSIIGRVLYQSVQGKIQMKMICREPNTRSVVLLLVASIYHYFNDEIWLAWRFCGIAGRMAIELGLHQLEIFQHIFKTQGQRNEASCILWSIVVLDRHWSCAIGLPQNFQESDFDKCLPVPENAQYLKAMASYGLFNPSHWDPTHRTIASGAGEDDDSFEFLNFQVEQWRKKALQEQDFVHPNNRENLDILRSPKSVPTLLYLRANQLRGLLLRPFFMSTSNLATSRRLAKPGLELALDTIHILFDIDKRTNIYRKQLPIFRHFLASSVALILLVIAHNVQSHSISSSDLWNEFLPTHITEGITRAVDLATTYANSSTVSHRLWKRLVSIQELFSSLEIIPRDNHILRRTPTEGFSNSDLVQASTPSSLPESTLLSNPAADNEFATSFSAEELSSMVDNNDQSYLAADINIGTLDGQEWYAGSWELNEINKLF